jgi:hypothetical protein
MTQNVWRGEADHWDSNFGGTGQPLSCAQVYEQQVPWDGKTRLLCRGFVGVESENIKQTREIFGRSLLPNNEQ